MIKLYLPYGSLRAFSGSDQIALHWFCPDRAEPVAPYENLVLGYKQMGEEQQRNAEAMVRELLTQNEFYALRDYLINVKNEDVRTGMLIAPVNAMKPANELGLGLQRPFGQHADGDGGGFFKLSEESDYNLPFNVWGYYSIPNR